MIRRVLIANRGEIARRIIRTADRMGIETVAVFSDADATAPHVREATRAIRIGPPPARESYLDVDAVLGAAREGDADAVHPGYGFLSENAAFAERVIDEGLTWIGPPPSAIRAMGLKDAAKRLMGEAGVAVTPGYLGENQSPERLAAEAERIGYPVLIKAVAGGGGKGMRRVDEPGAFAAALAGAKREAAAGFGDDRVLIETYVARPRHIEVQVFADRHGNAVHLYERDCSLQRRHQKVIEEAPAPGMDVATRAAVCDAAVRAARAVAYEGAGTVEFIADASDGLRPDRIWFMEMNTRLQVEHPVTEMVTGLDLVEWQFRVASGEPLPLRQEDIRLNGWAMEARLYAENPAKRFLPSTGKLEHFRLPAPGDGLRIDSGVEPGGEVTPFYDPMIAKLIAHADTREAAAAKLATACKAVEVWPVKTNAAFLARCLDQPDFVAGQVDTGFIPAREAELTARGEPESLTELAAAAILIDQLARDADFQDSSLPWKPNPSGLCGFRLNGSPGSSARVYFDNARVIDLRFKMDENWNVLLRNADQEHCANISYGRSNRAGAGRSKNVDLDARNINWMSRKDDSVVTFLDGATSHGSLALPEQTQASAASSGQLSAPMPGRIVSVSAAVGQSVSRGAAVVTLEAMKMEHALTAPFDARVAELAVKVGDQVVEGAVLARLEPAG